MPELFIGCSGFSYPHWHGRFYPDKLPQKRWFDYYCNAFASVELNVTFYRLLKPEVFAHWRLESPESFIFSVKGSRFITHVKRLADPELSLERFFEGALHLGEKLRVVLWQFPPAFACNIRRLEQFFKLLSRYPIRNALEFRHESWCCEEVVSLCRDYRVAICMADWPDFIAELPLTADFVYLRRHGRGGSYTGCYYHDELIADAGRIRNYLVEGRDVYIYFNNDAEACAPANARELAQILGSGTLQGEDGMT
jgi:uncharacterized protein YecE (DUF72 family)